MTMNNTLTAEQKEQALRLFTWCLDNNNEHFHVFYDFQGHCNAMQLSYCKDGWSKYDDPIYLNTSNPIPSKQQADVLISELERELAESIQRNAHEFKEQREEKAKEKRIIDLKQELKELEG